MQSDIVIIGGGASGLTAAISSALLGAKVIIIDHKSRVGQKILVTGNGKCNLTNAYQNEDCYRSEHSEIAFEIINQFAVKDTLDFFYSLGMLVKEKQGYYYPISEQASTVLDVLRWKCEELHVQMLCNATVKEIIKKKNTFAVEIINEKGNCDCINTTSLILATGGMASAKTGSDGSGYLLAKKLGHSIIEPTPALTGLYCFENFFTELAGVRVQANITLIINGSERISEKGELQLTNYGISGIPVFQISRFASKALKNKQNVKVNIDFLPDYEGSILEDYLKTQISYYPKKRMEHHLYGLLNKKIANLIIKMMQLQASEKDNKLSKMQIEHMIQKIKNFQVTVKQANSFENAQVSAGGIPLTEIFADSLESKVLSNLFIVGELLDVDGMCGGYNLQWAWSTGYLAGRSAGIRSNKIQ